MIEEPVQTLFLHTKPLVALTEEEITSLRHLCERKVAKFPVWSTWMVTVLRDEMERREKGEEPKPPFVPAFNGKDFADVIAGSYVFSRLPMSEGQHAFLDSVGLMVTGAAAGAIETYLPETYV